MAEDIARFRGIYPIFVTDKKTRQVCCAAANTKALRQAVAAPLSAPLS